MKTVDKTNKALSTDTQLALQDALFEVARTVLHNESINHSDCSRLEFVRKRALSILFRLIAAQMSGRRDEAEYQPDLCDLVVGSELIPADIWVLGDYYQSLLDCRLDFTEGRLQVVKRGHSQKREGCFYTPKALVDKIVRMTIAPIARCGVPPSILDPAVGTGCFLLGCADYLSEQGFDRSAILKNLHGVDCDPVAVEIARYSLWLWSENPSRETDDLSSIRCADSLSPDAFHEPAEYDAVIGNPPWVSFSGRQAEELPEPLRQDYSQRFYGFQGWLSTHGLFMELAVRLCKPGGRISLLSPIQITDLAGYAKLREVITTHATLDGVEHIGESQFDGVTQPAGIYSFTKREAPMEGSPVEWSTKLPENDPCNSLIQKLVRHPTLPLRTFRDMGVHTGNSAALILTDDLSRDDSFPVREGRQITRYALAPAEKGLLIREDLPPQHYFRVGPQDNYTSVSILIRQTATRPMAAIHDNPGYFRNSVLACHPPEGVDPFALLGLLNSRLIAFFHRHKFRDSRHQAFPQVKISHLRSIPVPECDMGKLAELARKRNAVNPDDLMRVMALDQAVDQLVYEMYGLAAKEIEVIESEPIKSQ